MKKKSLILALSAVCFIIISCGQKQSSEEEKTDTTTVAVQEDTLLLLTVPQTAVYGHLGDETGMSTIQFVTEKGDTMELDRTDESSGRDGLILGDIRNYTDTFAVVLNPDGESFQKAINITELNELKNKYQAGN